MSDRVESEGAVGTQEESRVSQDESRASRNESRASRDGEDDAYGGILTAYPYAFRASDSWLFKSYAFLGGFVTVGIVLLFTFALVELIGDTAGATGGTFTFSRAFFVVLMALVVAPLVAPVLFVARRHRRRGGDRRYDRVLAAGGYLFVLALYVGLAISVPPALQADSPGAVGSFLYSLPRPAGVVPPLAGAALVYLLHRRYR